MQQTGTVERWRARKTQVDFHQVYNRQVHNASNVTGAYTECLIGGAKLAPIMVAGAFFSYHALKCHLLKLLIGQYALQIASVPLKLKVNVDLYSASS